MATFVLDPESKKLVPKESDALRAPVDAGQLARSNQYPYLSMALDPKTTKGARVVDDPVTGGKRVLIESARHEREVAALNGLEKDGMAVEDGTERFWQRREAQPEWEEDWASFYGYEEGDWGKYHY